MLDSILATPTQQQPIVKRQRNGYGLQCTSILIREFTPHCGLPLGPICRVLYTLYHTLYTYIQYKQHEDMVNIYNQLEKTRRSIFLINLLVVEPKIGVQTHTHSL